VHSWIYVVDAENFCAADSPAASPVSLPSVALDPIVNTLITKQRVRKLSDSKARGVRIQNIQDF
jgi:hypothetical protein